MSKGSKRPSYKALCRRHNANTRELAALVGKDKPPLAPKPPRKLRPPARPKAERPPRLLTEREQAIRSWYLYGGADDEPPDGLTEEELIRVRRRLC